MYDLIKFGKYLNDKKLDLFGKIVKDNDIIFHIIHKNNTFNINGLMKKEDYDFNNFYNNSRYSKDLFIITDQKIMIPSKSNLMGLTPFFLKLDHDFLKNKDIDKTKVNKFKDKIERSLKANMSDKEFINKLIELFNNSTVLSNCPISNKEYELFIEFFRENELEDLKKIIKEYYTFLNENSDEIINQIIKYKQSDAFNKKERNNFFIVCTFNNEFDLLNDLFYLYSKFLKQRNDTPNYKEGVCSFCGAKEITVPASGSFVLDKMYSFNYQENMENSKVRICKKCNSYLMLAEDKLKNSLVSNIMIIPKLRNDEYSYEEFNKILQKDCSNIEKINNLLEEDITDEYDFDLAIYTKEKGDSFPIRHYIENYKAYNQKFKDAELLDENNNYTYLNNERKINSEKQEIYFKVENMFDLERIFKNFFISINRDGKEQKLKLKYFYEIYTKDFRDITTTLDSKTTLLFSKYMHNIFMYIYELNDYVLNKSIINEIVLNCILNYVKYSNGGILYILTICDRLNEYYMIIKEFFGEEMLTKENIKKLEKELNEYSNAKKQKDKTEIENILNSIFELINEDIYLKYYVIGQFIRYIDNFKFNNNINPETFNNYITNVNRNNICKLFATDIIQKNLFYINKMSVKGKFLFTIIENNLDKLFDEKELSYEDYILTMTTGYYTKNILKSSEE